MTTPGEFYNSNLAVEFDKIQGPDMFDEYSYFMQFSFTVVDTNSDIYMPDNISIDNIYPNPFNPTTTIDFSV